MNKPFLRALVFAVVCAALPIVGCRSSSRTVEHVGCENVRGHSESMGLARAEKSYYISLIPDDEAAFARMFDGRQYTHPQHQEITDAIDALRGSRANGVIADPLYGKTNLENTMKNVPAEHFFLIGHSTEVDGHRTLRLPNGTTVRQDEIIALAASAKKECYILTCNNPEINAKRKMSLRDASKITSDTCTAIERGEIESSEEVSRFIQEEFKKQGKIRKLRVTAIATGSAVTAGYWFIYETGDENDHGNKGEVPAIFQGGEARAFISGTQIKKDSDHAPPVGVTLTSLSLQDALQYLAVLADWVFPELNIGTTQMVYDRIRTWNSTNADSSFGPPHGQLKIIGFPTAEPSADKPKASN